MPKETFFNLVEDKRERIIDSAMDEFAENSFHKASINRIIKNAAIPKGSFYQYFEDKKDLYLYIVQLIVQKKMEIGATAFLDESLNTFEVLKVMMKGVVSMAKENPRLSAIGDQLLGDSELYKELMGQYGNTATDWLTGLIKRDMAKNLIDPSIDPELLAVMINGMFIQIGQYVRNNGSAIADEKSFEAYEKVIKFVEYGIRRR